jgi:hypothetical protein
MPASLWLNQFGSLVYHAFGEYPYHVGSSVKEKLWRDVDVRVMLADDLYEAMGLGKGWRDSHQNARWMAFCVAFSALGKQMTGLPIDFQIQKLSEANAMFSSRDGHTRSCLGIEGLEMDVMPAPTETNRATDQLLAESRSDHTKTGGNG